MTDDVDELIPARFAGVEPAWADELDEAIIAGVELPAVAAEFEIPDDGWAEWAMRKLATLATRAEAVGEQAAAWRRPIDEWEVAEKARVEGGIEFFAGLLERYALRQRAANPKAATLRLPSGTVGTTAPRKPTVTVVDEEALIAWAQATLPTDVYDTVVKSTEKVLVGEFRKIVATRVREVPFCQVCGAQIARFETGLGDAWSHRVDDGDVFDPLVKDDVDHYAKPVEAFDVVLIAEHAKGDGSIEGEPVVPGVEATLAATTARAHPANPA